MSQVKLATSDRTAEMKSCFYENKKSLKECQKEIENVSSFLSQQNSNTNDILRVLSFMAPDLHASLQGVSSMTCLVCMTKQIFMILS